jgi:hypothetical protein
VHADAPTLQETDWPQIVVLFDRLLAVAPTPVVTLSRVIAIGEVQGPAAAPREPICLGGWAGTARGRGRLRACCRYGPTKAERDLLRLVAALHAERIGDLEQVCGRPLTTSRGD